MYVRVGNGALSVTGWEVVRERRLCRGAVSASAATRELSPFVAKRKENLPMRNRKIIRLAYDAMLTAMYVVLSMTLTLRLPNMKITLDSLPVLVGACLLGPIDGMAIGLLGSFINQLLTYGLSVTTVLWILPAGIRGLLVGIYARRRSFELTVPQTIYITSLTALLITALNTAVMYVDSKIFMYYSYEYVFGAVIFRVISGIITAVALSLILPGLVHALRRALPKNPENVRHSENIN